MKQKKRPTLHGAFFALLSLSLFSTPALSQPLAIKHLAESPGTPHWTDEKGSSAGFFRPEGVAVTGWGNVSAPVLSQPLTITHFAGSPGGRDWIDGTGSSARFHRPSGVAVDGSGNVYVADTSNSTIRKITPSGVVSTLAGLASAPTGSTDGIGTAARFSEPMGVAVDGSGSVFVADTRNCTIRKIIAATGQVSTLAGLARSCGSADGTGSDARFSWPMGVSVDGSGNVYVADTANRTIRKITPSGVVSTLAGLAGSPGSVDGIGSAARFGYPTGVAVDGEGNVYVADAGNNTIRMVTPAGVVSTLAGLAGVAGSVDGTGSAARFNYPAGVTVDRSGNVYVGDTDNSTIRKIMPVGVVSTLAGLASNSGSVDGTGSGARFNGPRGVAVDGSGNVYLADSENFTIRKILPAGAVSTFAGGVRTFGSADGTGSDARFNSPWGVAVGSSGNLYVADSQNHTIRKVTPAGVVSTLAGLAGSYGSADGTGSEARFYNPSGLAVDGSGNVYVADTYNQTIRKVSPFGVVSTLAGLAGSYGSADGTGSAARFRAPTGVVVDGTGDVYVADRGNHTIRKVTSAGVVSTLAGLAGSYGRADGAGSAARFDNPTGVAVDDSGRVYVADYFNNTVREISPSGVVATLAGLAGVAAGGDGTGSGAQFNYPAGVTVDASGNVYVADSRNYTIRRITPSGVVRTVAGLAGFYGSADGTGSDARFSLPVGLAIDSSGNVFVADSGNHCIRKGAVASFADVATIDASTGPTGQLRQFDTFPQQATKWLWEAIRRPAASTATLSSTTIRNPTLIPDVPDLYMFRLTATDNSGSQSITTVSLTATTPVTVPAVSRLLPVVVDVAGEKVHFTTEIALTNNTTATLPLSMQFITSIGSCRYCDWLRPDTTTVKDYLLPGEQKRISNVISYLVDRGLPISPAPGQYQVAGTLLVTFRGFDVIDPKLVSVTARTATPTVSPQPAGRAGLAYSGLRPEELSTSILTIYGLRSTPADRSNVAVLNTSTGVIGLKVTVCSGTGDGRCVVIPDLEGLSPYEWRQYNSLDILYRNGITKGWAIVERTSGKGSFSAYGVINDNATNDGSFILPVESATAALTLTVPVLAETPDFRSELILANKSASSVTLTLSYVESTTPSSGAGGTMIVTLAPVEERIIPEAIDFLRTNGVNIGAKDAAPYVGALRISVSGTAAENVFAGARTSSQSPATAGGQFGLFTPGIYSGQEASTEAYLYGLRADAENRTNVAVVNTGDDSAGPILLQLQAYDGDAFGAPKGEPASVSLSPGQWAQPPGFFKNSGVANGWVKVTRMSGTAPWIAYGVINDGGNPGERTGDGAYVPMVK
jgi:sugar lactone lactonase YvrE